jgi:putative nucleotidyltransferase with HDIG domain
MKAAGQYSEKEINDMCLLALVHDIGAFKTEEISRLVAFDSENAWEHSIYGYLFIKNFSPLFYLAPVILFHHTSLKFMNSIPPYYRDLAQILHIADRLEILYRGGKKEKNQIIQYFTPQQNAIFSADILPLFYKHQDFSERDEFWQKLCHIGQSRGDIDEYLKMLVLSIDFRSRHTVNHTVATAELSRLIAGLFHLSAEDVQHIRDGALLHDIGKAGIPAEILENPGRLNQREMEIMKTHILLTGQILKGRVSEKVERIAFRHHEKLNGSGYPDRLTASHLTFPERLVAVADILSALSGARSYKKVFPKDNVVAILTAMSAEGQLDAAIVQKIVENYDFLIQETALATHPVTQNYDKLALEYGNLLTSIGAMQSRKDFQFTSFFTSEQESPAPAN